MTSASDVRAPTPTRKPESSARRWWPWIAGLFAALALSELLWVILMRLGTITSLSALLAIDAADQGAFDTGQLQPFLASTQGVESASLASLAAANAALTLGASQVATAAQQAAALDVTIDAALVLSNSAVVVVNTALSIAQGEYATLTGKTINFVDSANTASVVWTVPFALLKIGRTVTAFFGDSYPMNPNTGPLISDPLTTGGGGTQPSDQDPTGPALRWMPPSNSNFFVSVGGIFPLQAPAFVSPFGFCQISPSSTGAVLLTFTTSWMTL